MRVSRTLATAAIAAILVSALSAAPVSADTDVILLVVADTYTASSAPGTSYGSSTSMGVYATPDISAVLRVVIPAPPAGETLTAATLSLRTTSIASAGSANAVQVRLADDGWTEAGAVYTNRPAIAPQVIGTLPGGTLPNSGYDIAVDVTALSALSGSITMALVGTGADSSWFWSREATAALRPVLRLQYTASAPTDTEPPVAPGSPTVTVTDTTVALSWGPSSDNVGVTGYRIHRGATADFVPGGATQVGESVAASFTEANVPPGSWYYRVVASDAAGNLSTASVSAAAIIAPPPQDTQAPSTPIGASASVAGASVLVSWAPSTDNVGVTGYRVHRGTSASFLPDAATQVAATTTTSFTDAGVPEGDWFYRVIAVDAAGNMSAASAAAAVTIPPPPVDPVTLVAAVTEDAMVVGVSPTTAYGTNTQLSTRGPTSPIESFLRVTLPAAPAGTTLTAAVLSIRTSTDPTAGSADPHSVRLVTGGGWSEPTVTWNTRPTSLGALLGVLGQAPATNTPYTVALDPALLSALLGTSATLAMTSAGADNARWWSREAPYAPYRPTLSLTFEPGGPTPPDTQPPTVPSGVTATVAGTAVAVTWQPSTDDTAVAGYEVHRGTTTGFTPTSATRIADVTGTSFTDQGRPVGTWYYRVTAHDAAGNHSGASGEVAATVQASGPPVTRTLAVIADTYTSPGAPSTNYGTSASLGVYGTPEITSLVRVELPEPPDGAAITGVTLVLRTTTLTSAGSADQLSIRAAADTWSEDGTVYTNRPAVSGPVLGTLAGGTAPNAAYSIALDPSWFQGRTGSISLAVIGAGSDSSWFWSRNSPTASYRPALTVTYQSTPVDPPPSGLTATVMAVGDIACQSGTPVTAVTCRHGDVADLIADADPDRFLALGDLQYQDATLAQFLGAGAYDDTFGQLRATTLPVLGNHEYHVSTDGYFDYFYGSGVATGPFGDRATGYYTANIGSWRFIGLNTECGPVGVPGGCDVGSPQYEWLRNLLVNSPTQCTIVAAHRPRWSTGASHGSYSQLAALWDLMAANHVDIVVSAHNHATEIFKPIGVSGSGASPNLTADGIRAFTAGGGGANLQNLSPTTDPLLTAVEARSRSAFGPLKLTLADGDYSWEYLPISGMSFTGSGTTGSFSGSESCR